MSDLIYQEDVMDHYENPRNIGEMDHADMSGRDANASCGDMVEFQIKSNEGVIEDVKWKGIGCAITTASSSKLSEWLIGKKVAEVREMGEGGLKDAIGIEVNPGRSKCLTLPIKVVLKLVGV